MKQKGNFMLRKVMDEYALILIRKQQRNKSGDYIE